MILAVADAPAVDISGLLALRQLQAPGKPDVVARIVRTFLEESAARVVALHKAIDRDDAEQLERAAHALKGMAGTVGANEMLSLAVRLELFGREGRTQDGRQLVTQLESAFDRARPIFDQLIETPASE